MARLLLVVLLLGSLACYGQKIQNVKAEVQGATIVLTYDIVEGQSGDTYTVVIYPSNNNFKNALMRVSGDVGKGVTQGTGKRVTWDAKAELVSFKGEITFEIQAEVVAALSFSPAPKSAKRIT